MHRRHKKPYAVIFIVVVALVIFGAVRDMDRLKNPIFEISPMRMHYAAEAEDFGRLPRDTSPVMIHIGTLSPQEDKTYTFTSSGIEPTTLPQREVVLAFSIAGDVPDAFSDFNRTVEEQVNAWKRKNNKITEIYLEWNTPSMDTEKLAMLAGSLRTHLKLDYWIGLGMKRQWFGDDPALAAPFAARPAGIRDYVYDLEEIQRDGETLADSIAALDKLGIRSAIRVKTMPPENEGAELMKTYENFAGFIVHR